MANTLQNKHGLTETDLDDLQRVFAGHKDLKEVILFGSRALGRYKTGSDLDLALISEANLTITIKTQLEETNLPYFFDVIDLATISSPELLEHIKKYGVKLYKK